MNKCLEHIMVDVLGKHENYERRNQNHDNNRQEHFVTHFHLDTYSSSGIIVIIIIHFVKWKAINHDPV